MHGGGYLMYESPLMACEFGDSSHPLYHKCDRCPDTHLCSIGPLYTKSDEQYDFAQLFKNIDNPFGGAKIFVEKPTPTFDWRKFFMYLLTGK